LPDIEEVRPTENYLKKLDKFLTVFLSVQLHQIDVYIWHCTLCVACQKWWLMSIQLTDWYVIVDVAT